MIKQLTNTKILKKKQIQYINKRYYIYDFDIDHINFHLDLNKYNNQHKKDFHDIFLNNDDIFID